jgi:hypothetical protein
MRMCMLAGVFAAIELILVFYYSEEMEVKTARAHYLAGVYLIAAAGVSSIGIPPCYP